MSMKCAYLDIEGSYLEHMLKANYSRPFWTRCGHTPISSPSIFISSIERLFRMARFPLKRLPVALMLWSNGKIASIVLRMEETMTIFLG